MTRLLLLGLLLAAVQANTRHVTVAGLGGEADYEQRFTSLAREAEKYLKTAPGSTVETLSGKGATREALKAAIARAAAAPAEEPFVLLLIGHGTFDGVDYKFNVPGPDVSASELREWLDKVAAPTLVILGTSSSGAAIPALQRPNRAVITATRSGNERLAVVFSRYWVEALRDPLADTDKNNAVSALEAFRYADQKVVKYYESQQRLVTEHALLEDTGKGDGVRQPGPENGRGLLAARINLVRFGQVQESLQSPEKQLMLKRREEIQQSIDKLKYEKAAMPADEYKNRLRGLLVELAKLEEQIEK
jgi:hypothetical protein